MKRLPWRLVLTCLGRQAVYAMCVAFVGCFETSLQLACAINELIPRLLNIPGPVLLPHRRVLAFWPSPNGTAACLGRTRTSLRCNGSENKSEDDFTNSQDVFMQISCCAW